MPPVVFDPIRDLRRGVGTFTGKPLDFDPLDNDDDYGVPSEDEFRQIQAQSPDGSAPATSESFRSQAQKARREASDRLSGSYDRMTQVMQSKPDEQNFKPNKWQRIAAAAAGFGAGFVNSGGRVRVDPEATASLTNSLMRPGYDRAMRKWGTDVETARAGVDAARNRYSLNQADERLDNEQTRADAYAKAQGANAEYDRKRAEAAMRQEWIVSPRGDSMINKRTGDIKPLPVSGPTKPQPETPEQKWARMHKEAVDGLGYQPGSVEYRAHMGDFSAREELRAKNRGSGKAGKATKARTGTPGQFRMVEKDKQAELRKAEKEHRKRMADGTPEDESLKLLEVDKQSIMDSYDAGVESLGGSVIPRGQQKKAPTPPAGPVPGMEKLGGKPPGVPLSKPPVIEQQDDAAPKIPPPGAKTATNPKTGKKVWFDESTKQWLLL